MNPEVDKALTELVRAVRKWRDHPTDTTEIKLIEAYDHYDDVVFAEQCKVEAQAQE